MRAHEALDSDDPAVAENAAEILRTMARICDDMRHLGDLTKGPVVISLPQWCFDIWCREFATHSDGAPVEDWLDRQWAAPVATDTPYEDWPEKAQQRLLSALAISCPVCGGMQAHAPNCSLATALAARPWLRGNRAVPPESDPTILGGSE